MKPSLLIAALLLAIATSAGAQTIDARWAPFIGCWELTDGGASTCVAPAAPGAVTLSTRVQGNEVLEQTIVADGATHPVTEDGCSGSQRAEWSRDGRKLFSRADLTCANQPLRTVTGVALMTGDASWINVQAVEIAGGTSMRISRYRRAQGDRPRPQTSVVPYFGAAMLTIDDVKEAHTKVAPAVVEAMVAETGARFPLSARELVALDDAGVPGNVIDLMIANSFPEKFQVERRAAARVDSYSSTYGPGWSSSYWGLGYPYFYSYPGYYVDYRDYYSPYGYAYGYPGSYYYYPGPSAGGDEEPPDGGGRVVNGVGYTRVRTRDAATTRSDEGSGTSSGSSTSRPASSGRGAMTSSGATQSSGGSSSSGGGTSSSGGGSSSSGGGSSDSGRTAQPR